MTLQLLPGSHWTQLESERFTFLGNSASSTADCFPALLDLVSRIALDDVRLGEQLLVAQCHHGVYPHRTPGRDVTGRQRHEQEQEHNNDKHHR